MPIGDFTKQLAQQAIGNAINSATESPKPEAPETSGAVMLGEIRAMQSALKDDNELGVFFWNGFEVLRVLEIYVPAPDVAVLIGNAAGTVTRVVARFETLQLTCKVIKVPSGAKPVRVAFREAKPR